MRSINKAGLDIIRNSEGLRLKAYRCPANVLTIGYGHTGSDVKEGQAITNERATELLVADLAKFEAGVNQFCPVATDNQFSALVSFAFNLGLGALKDSTLRRMHNEGNHEGAQGQFSRWNKASGRVLPGLTKRRAAESALYGAP